MNDSIKTWFVEVGVKKLAPSFIKSAITGVVALIAAHSGVLDKYGIVSDITTGDITIHSKMLMSWIDSAAGLACMASLLTLFQHHTSAAITGAPQSGDLRKVADAPVQGGDRKTDPPEGA